MRHALHTFAVVLPNGRRQAPDDVRNMEDWRVVMAAILLTLS